MNASAYRLIKFALIAASVVLSACASGPKPAEWQLNAKGATERAIAAYLEGNTRVELAEMAKARQDISSTGRVDLMARAELLSCASRVASLVFETKPLATAHGTAPAGALCKSPANDLAVTKRSRFVTGRASIVRIVKIGRAQSKDSQD